jgi:hypothetical protein
MPLTTHDTAKLIAMKKQIEGLSPGNRLRLAADLIDARQYAIAETIARNVVDELTAVRVLLK